ncbi:MAG: hypothetical protein SF051_12610 [Elusimicrobiota bacterium]|nr:hypothetical protein [Elusimicrobiota bacterium]
MMSARAAALVRDWGRLSPLARVAAWRRLPRAEAARVFRALPDDGRWLLYLGCDDGALAPLTGAERAGARRVGRAERAAYRRALA